MEEVMPLTPYIMIVVLVSKQNLGMEYQLGKVKKSSRMVSLSGA
jgi:hypothetical protein